MGSPHQLYIIAKVNGRYRSLAALYLAHDNKGKRAVDVCRRLIEIIEDLRNRTLLLHELQLASSIPHKKWEAAPEYPSERPAFPLVTTCLLLGASLTPETGYGLNATHDPFNMPLVAAPEGCTVLDVTNPAAVRYAFLFALPQESPPEGLVRTVFGNKPLSAWEYAAFYGDLFDEGDYCIAGDDAVIARVHACFEEMLKAQDVIDSQPWGRRADLGLPPISPQSRSEIDDAPLRRQPATQYVEALYQAFEHSYKLFQPGYSEGHDTQILAPKSAVRQVVNLLYLGSLEDSSWQARAAEYKPKSLMIPDNAVRTDLDVLQSWTTAAAYESKWRGRKENEYFFNSFAGQSDQNMVKYFSLAGPNHRVVKPLPGRAFYYAKQSYHCNVDWATASLEEIKQGEWTAFLVQQWRQEQLDFPSMEHAPLGFRCAFVSLSADGEVIVADAETFRSASFSTPAADAVRELDPGEKTYGRGLVDLLGRDDSAIKVVPVSVMDREEVLELLDAMEIVKAREDKRLENS